jgi:lysophospholipase L1-like esterase
MRAPTAMVCLLTLVASPLPLCAALACAALGCAAASEAGESPAAANDTATPAAPTDEPLPRDRDFPWMSRTEWFEKHAALVAIAPATRRAAKLVFLGDSITAGWDEAVWAESFATFHPLRLGIGGDRTQNVLWRVDHGELDGLDPAVLVLLIGTNNLGADGVPPAAAAKGVAKVVEKVRQRLPRTRVLVLGILPFDEQPTSRSRQAAVETNALLARLDDGRQVRVLDIGSRLVEPDGRISREVMADFLHPTSRGYRTMASAITPLLTEMLAGAD